MTEINVDYCCGLTWQYTTDEVLCQGTFKRQCINIMNLAV